MPDEQPVEGQDGGSGSPYDSYLESVPDQAREAAEAWFKDTSKGLDAKLQEAAEIQKTWGPYKDAFDPQAVQPEQLSQLIAWWQNVTSSDEAWRDWLSSEAKEAGLTQAQESELEQAEMQGELTREEIQKIIEEKAAEQVGPLREELTELQSERAINAMEQDIRGRMTDLEKESGNKYSEEQKAMIFDLGKDAPEDADWVKLGHDRFLAAVATAQKDFVADKSKVPGAPMQGGGGQEKLRPTTDFKEAEAQGRERLKQLLQS